MQLPYQFGPGSGPLKEYDLNEKHAKRVQRLLKLPAGRDIISIGKHYLLNFIPMPFEHENTYWMCSCFPGTDSTPIRFNIYWHEVLNIHKSGEATGLSNLWNAMIFIDSNYIDDTIKRNLTKRIPQLIFDKDFRYRTGLESQLAVRLPITSYFDFVADENIYESIRQYNFQLSCKGKIAHSGHNYELARTMLKSNILQ